MKLVAKKDVEAPAAFVFRQMSDFEGWERAAMRRGAEVTRTDKLTSVGQGMAWDTQFTYRGKERRASLRLDSITHNSALALSARSAPVNGTLQIDIIDLAAKRTRIELRLEVRPNTLSARILLQSLRLARARVDRNYDQRVAQLAAEIEDRYRRSLRPA